MVRSHRLFAPLGAGVAGLSLALASASSGATNSHPRTLIVPERAATGTALRPFVRRHRSYAVAPTTCATNFPNSTAYFTGVTGGSDVAGGTYAAVAGGMANEACDESTGIGAGEQNVIGNSANAMASFIGGGYANAIVADYAFVGAGIDNEVTGQTAFVGGGHYGTAEGAGSFVGAGGYEFGQVSGGAAAAGSGDVAAGADSFVGAGDLNQISSAGSGSFIGGGGYYEAQSGSTAPNNTISATDAFVGAGNHNTVGAQEGFVGAGFANNVSGLQGTIAGGFENSVSSQDGFVGGGLENVASNFGSFVGAGGANAASGSESFAGAGNANSASGFEALSGAGQNNTSSGYYSALVGGYYNVASGNGAFIGGGGYNYYLKSGGTANNVASGSDSFVGAGDQNSVGAPESVIGGGQSNTITSAASEAVLAGGVNNVVTAQKGVVGGGEANEAEGSFTTVPGGYHNLALGNESFAAGAQAQAKNTGTFVWSDYASGESPLTDKGADTFVARASGGVYFFSNAGATAGVELAAGSGTWSSLSDRNAKAGVVPLDDASILAKVAGLPISTWHYKTESGVTHVGPMAQDFYAAFRVGEDDRHITSIDEDGIALSAIKALHRENGRLADDNRQLHRDNARLLGQMNRLEANVAALRTSVDALTRR